MKGKIEAINKDVLLNKVNVEFNIKTILNDYDIIKIESEYIWDNEKPYMENIKVRNKARNRLYDLVWNDNSIQSYSMEEDQKKIRMYVLSDVKYQESEKLKKKIRENENYKTVICKEITEEDIEISLKKHEDDGVLPAAFINRNEKEKYGLIWHIYNLFSNLAFNENVSEKNTIVPNRNGLCIKLDPEKDDEDQEPIDRQIVGTAIEVTRDFHINVVVKTFATIEKWREYQKKKNGIKTDTDKLFPPRLYQLQPTGGTLCLNIVTPETQDKKEQLFTAGNYAYIGFKKRNNKNFNETKGIEEFNDSKMGILVEYLNNMKKLFNKYLTITSPISCEFTQYPTSKLHFEEEERARLEKIKEKGIHIFAGKELYMRMSPAEKEEQYEKYKKDINLVFTEKEMEPPEITGLNDTPENDKYNICLIWEKRIYKKEKIPDDHKEQYNALVQHATVKKISKPKEKPADKGKKKKEKATSAIKVILKELIIKEEIRNKKIFQENINPNIEKICRVAVIRKKIKVNNMPVQRYYIAIISPNGELNFATYKEDKPQEFPYDDDFIMTIQDKYNDCDERRKTQDYEDLDDILIGYISNPNYLKNSEEDSINRLYILYITKYFPSPNLENVKNLLEKTDKEKPLETKEVRSILENTPFPINPNIIEEINKCRNAKEEMPLYDLKKLLTTGTIHIAHAGRKNKNNEELLNYVENEYNKNHEDKIQFEAPMKRNKELEFENIEGINIKRVGNFIYYYVGYKNINDIKQNQARAVRIRKIYDPMQQIEIEKFIQELIIDQKIKEQFPVKPFSAKYLQEYANEMAANEADPEDDEEEE